MQTCFIAAQIQFHLYAVLFLVFMGSCAPVNRNNQIKEEKIPVSWTTYHKVNSIEDDFLDLKDHGIEGIVLGEFGQQFDLPEARQYLKMARKYGIKLAVPVGNHLLPSAEMVIQAGLEPEYAIMIGGVYQGKAIDRHLFSFTPATHNILIEPPVYNQKFAYTGRISNEPIAHYYPEIGSPLSAEIIVPLKPFDGQQHLATIPAQIKQVESKRLKEESVSEDMPPSYETEQRKLYQISFDLSNYRGALLDQVGIAVYWQYEGSEEWYILDWSPVSVLAATTIQAVQQQVKKTMSFWSEVNEGKFPNDILKALRFGDEPFFVTGHLKEESPAVNYPLWDYSPTAIDSFKRSAENLEHPRTWGFPEIYGEKAYASWMYTFHKNCAEVVRMARLAAQEIEPEIKLFRNTTRNGVFSLSNDHDGSGPELLTQQLDWAHIDPYPVSSTGYNPRIWRDMSYYRGLASRYQRPLIPWMQAHRYGELTHVTPAHIQRMTQEQWEQGIDAIMWLGYSKSSTFPQINPASWEAAAAFHQRLQANLPPKPKPKLAVIRSYNAWSLSHQRLDQIRNPDDWLLQQWLEVWAVRFQKAYDVFELPPDPTPEYLNELKITLRNYDYVISNIPFENTWYVGKNNNRKEIRRSEADSFQDMFAIEIKEKGWLTKSF